MKESASNSSSHKQSHSSQSSTHRQPAISDLRNQVTIVSQNNRTTVGDKASALFGMQIERISIPLPFAAGEFEVTDFFTQGGMSTTYLGHKNTDPTERVIIKIPDVKNQKTVEMFRNECMILSELKHPNIVPILGYGDISVEGESYPYMAMKFIDGQSLRQKIKAQGHLSWEEASKVLKDILEALNYLCDKKFCHRDIKPDNIIYDTKSQKWILVDFGIAKSMQESIMLTMTMAGQDSGTWDYMPPEQLDGKAVDIRCDIYALGTVIWESLIGTVPRRGTKLPAAFGLELPLDVDILIGKMVEHNPDDRYQTPSDVLKALHSGAGRIELWNKTRRKIRIVTRYGALSAGLIILLVTAWLIGNFVAIAKAKEVYEEYKASPTIALRELNKEAAKYPFYWGKTYVEQKRSELLEKSKEERDKMAEQYSRIKTKNDIKQLTDEELDSLKTSCENFVAVWETIFAGSEEIAFAQARSNEISNIIKRRKEEAIVQKTKKDINEITKTRLPSDYQKGFDLYRNVKESITESDLKADLDQFALQLKKDAIGESLEEVQKLILDSTPQKWLDAKKRLEDIQKVLGDDPQIKKAEKDIDDQFWNYYLSRISEFLKNNRFADANGCLDDYERYSYNKHSSDVKSQRTIIANSELNYAFEQINKLILDSTPQKWLDAKSHLEDIQRVHGTDQRISNAKKSIDDNFWNYYSSRIAESLRNNQFNNARTYLDDYETYSYKMHSADVKAGRESIASLEMNHVLEDVNRLIRDSSPQNWLNAKSHLEDIQRVYGANTQINSAKKSIDDNFWHFYSSRISEALRNNRFAEARECLVDYEKYSYKMHSTDITTQRNNIATAELNHAYQETYNVYSQYIKDKAFESALASLTQFELNYPNSSLSGHINILRQNTANEYASFIIDQKTNLDSYQEHLKRYLNMFPSQKENIKVLKQFLCWSIHNAVKDIINDEEAVSQAKMIQLTQIKYSDCEEYQRSYLSKLISTASNYEAESNRASWYEFLFWYQRPPSDCVEMEKEPNIYSVTLTKFEASLSNSYYMELKGSNNADPVLKIGREDSDEYWWSIKGPVNQQSFTISLNHSFWWNIDDCALSTMIVDDDFFAASSDGVLWGKARFKNSGSASFSTNRGNTFKLFWTTYEPNYNH